MMASRTKMDAMLWLPPHGEIAVPMRNASIAGAGASQVRAYFFAFTRPQNSRICGSGSWIMLGGSLKMKVVRVFAS